MFKFHGLDQSAEICIVAYSGEAKKFDPLIVVRFIVFLSYTFSNLFWLKVNGVYTLEGFNAKDEKPEFRSKTGNEIELSLVKNSTLTKLEEEDDSIPKIPFKFLALNEVRELSSKSTVGNCTTHCDLTFSK